MTIVCAPSSPCVCAIAWRRCVIFRRRDGHVSKACCAYFVCVPAGTCFDTDSFCLPLRRASAPLPSLR